MSLGALDLPPDAIPHTEKSMRRRLRRAFLNLGYKVPADFARWGMDRMRAVWFRLIEEREKRSGKNA